MIYPSDNELAELLDLQARMKIMEKRITEIKDACKDTGSFFTAKYTVSVVPQKRVCLAGLDEVKKYVNEDILNKYGLIRTSEFFIVKIGRLPAVQPVSK